MVISGVAKTRTQQIKSLLFLDAPIPENNQSLLDILGSQATEFFYTMTQDNWRVQSFPAHAFGLEKQEDINWAFKQHTPQSLKTFQDKVAVLSSEHISKINVGYLLCLPGNAFNHSQAQKAKDKNWLVYEIDAGHCPMITEPKKLSLLLCNKILSDLQY